MQHSIVIEMKQFDPSFTAKMNFGVFCPDI